MSIMVGIGRGARSGILIRDAEALERMETIDTLVIDKTGTLTEGKPEVVAVVAAGGIRRERIAALAASVERASEHPLASAILNAAAERKLALARGARFRLARRQGRDRLRSMDSRLSLGNAMIMQAIERRHADTGGASACAARKRRDRDLCRRGWSGGRCHRHRRSGEGERAARR